MRLIFSTPELFLLFILSIAIFFFGNAQIILAETADTVGVSISPTLIEETQLPGSIGQYSISINNETQVEQTYTISAKSVRGMDSSGNPIFSEDGVSGFEIADWIDFNSSQVSVPAGQKEAVNFTVSVPADAAAGSHIGSIFVTAQPPEIEGSGLAVGYSVGNILHLIVDGESTTTASVIRFSTDKYIYGSAPVNFSLQLENTGTILIRPQGVLEIRDMLGRRVEALATNKERVGILPDSLRIFTVGWEKQQVGFGRYTAILTMSYGDLETPSTLSGTTTFWILPPRVILPALIGWGVILSLLLILLKMGGRKRMSLRTFSLQRATKQRRKKVLRILMSFVLMVFVTVLYFIALLFIFS